MEKLVIYFTPATGQLAGFASARSLRRAIPDRKMIRRQSTLPEINLIAGWSTASLIMIVGTGLLKIDLRIITAIWPQQQCLQLSECSGEAHPTDLPTLYGRCFSPCRYCGSPPR